MADEQKLSDVEILQGVVDGTLKAQPDHRSNEHALHDFSLPAIVRGFIAINMGPATETMAIREAGFMPALFAKWNGEPVRVTIVSRMGDVGIHRDPREEWTYNERVSIYDLTDFQLTPHINPQTFVAEKALRLKRGERR